MFNFDIILAWFGCLFDIVFFFGTTKLISVSILTHKETQLRPWNNIQHQPSHQHRMVSFVLRFDYFISTSASRKLYKKNQKYCCRLSGEFGRWARWRRKKQRNILSQSWNCNECPSPGSRGGESWVREFMLNVGYWIIHPSLQESRKPSKPPKQWK